ncbi:hypothetical protein MMC19_001009 [Ptychographa xylographoides]|nr:hypothetical protein [Ptychographa xylographoides]
MSRDDSNSSQNNSSLASSAHSPRSTPQLRRFDSNSSQGTVPTPSPMTPTYSFNPYEDHSKDNHPSGSRDPSYYPSNGPYYISQPQDAFQQPYYTHPVQHSGLLGEGYPTLGASLQTQFTYASPDLGTPGSPPSTVQTPAAATPTTSQSASISTGSSTKIGKKKYPCPHAARYGCSDTFTTSGHAARHGKKHTGEKNIHCPTCHKAFTRKDNMKQHERTHKTTSRDQIPDSPADVTPTAQVAHATTSKSQSTTAVSSPDTSNDLELSELDSELSGNPTSRSLQPQARRAGITGTIGYSRNNLSIDAGLAKIARPDFDRKFSGNSQTSQDAEAESPGLEILADAADRIPR